MKNGYKVVWTKKAIGDLDAIIHYLETNWAEKEITTFFQKLEKRIDLIAQRPQLYPPTKGRKNVHRSVILPQLTIYYRTNKATVEILTLFDNRQNPGKLKQL